MRESHRLLVKAWELEELAKDDPDPIRALELRKQADQLRIDSLNAREEPWRRSHTVLMVCLGVIIVIGFAAMCADVIAGLING
jgi:hypothetical protein